MLPHSPLCCLGVTLSIGFTMVAIHNVDISCDNSFLDTLCVLFVSWICYVIIYFMDIFYTRIAAIYVWSFITQKPACLHACFPGLLFQFPTPHVFWVIYCLLACLPDFRVIYFNSPNSPCVLSYLLLARLLAWLPGYLFHDKRDWWVSYLFWSVQGHSVSLVGGYRWLFPRETINQYK